jgi:hypothetical protein
MKIPLFIVALAGLLSACATQKQHDCPFQSCDKIVIPATEPMTGISRADILKMLPGRKWYWFWESQNRELPSKFIVTKNGDILRTLKGKPTQKWKLERRWVLNEGDHLLIPISDSMLRGFYIPSGRQVGMFADPNSQYNKAEQGAAANP